MPGGITTPEQPAFRAAAIPACTVEGSAGEITKFERQVGGSGSFGGADEHGGALVCASGAVESRWFDASPIVASFAIAASSVAPFASAGRAPSDAPEASGEESAEVEESAPHAEAVSARRQSVERWWERL